MPLTALINIVRADFDARAIALCRIAVGLAATGQAFLTWRLLLRLYSPEVARARLVQVLPDLTVNLVPFYAIAWLVASVCFTLGVLTPLSGLLLSCLLAYQLALDVNLYSNHVYLLLLATGLLTLAQSGSALSFDSRSQARRIAAATVPYTCVFLLRFQLTIMYFFTAAQKINARFLSGAVLQDIVVAGDAIPDVVLRLMAFSVIFTELFLAVGLWLTPVRKWAFAVGFLLHACIPILMPANRTDLIVFGVLTLGLYFTFVSPAKESGV